MHGAKILVIFEHLPSLINRAELAFAQGEWKADRAWVGGGIHGADDQVATAGQGMRLHVGQNGIDPIGIEKHQRHGSGNEPVISIQPGLIDVVDTGCDALGRFLRDDGLQGSDCSGISVHGGDVETLLAKIKGIVTGAAAHVERVAGLDMPTGLDHFAVGADSCRSDCSDPSCVVLRYECGLRKISGDMGIWLACCRFHRGGLLGLGQP